MSHSPLLPLLGVLLLQAPKERDPERVLKTNRELAGNVESFEPSSEALAEDFRR